MHIFDLRTFRRKKTIVTADLQTKVRLSYLLISLLGIVVLLNHSAISRKLYLFNLAKTISYYWPSAAHQIGL